MKAIIVGGGYIAATHVKAIRSLGHDVGVIVGRTAEHAEAFAQNNDISEWTTDLDHALSSDAEVVHICAPPMEHAEIIRKCFEAGKHIICEKPLAIDPDEAMHLAGEADEEYHKSGIISALCCNVRFYPAVRRMSDIIMADGRNEDSVTPKVFIGSYLQEFHIPPHSDGWRFDHDASGGQRAISEIGTHWIDLSYAVTGIRICEVCAELGNWFPVRYRKDGMLTNDADGEAVAVDTEDTAAILLRFENGAVGTLMLSETAPGHPNDLSIEITDLSNSYRWDESDPDYLWCSDSGAMTSTKLPDSDREDTFASLFREVYIAIEGKEHIKYPTFWDGAYISAVCSAISKSGSSHRWETVEY